MNKVQLKAFAKLQGQIKELEGKRDQMKADIVEAMTTEGTTKQETEWGTFTVAARRNYKYSQKVSDLNDKVKLLKIKEEENGTAKVSITEYLVYTN